MAQAIITGASSGIGYATAAAFSDAGFNVINLARRDCDLPTVKNITCDLAREDFVDQIHADLDDLLHPNEAIVLVHNAAVLANDSAAEIDAQSLRNILEVNLVAPARLNQLIIPKMQSGSAILYVGSTLGEKAVPNSFSYVTTKHASIGMMRATCQDLVGREIHTACINPGFTNTEMLRHHVPPEVMPQIAQMSAFGRLIEPEEIAKALLFAAQNPVLNGAVINANLGQIER